ncbi:family 78 glycoside hydrolase catalytic domain [candidate division KSB1 bacterium]|nr:family 78 glycoside hydrolase catalytic domain [candidate division KSB1 bacterium]
MKLKILIRVCICIILAWMVLLCPISVWAGGQLAVVNPRVEYKVNPVGIDVKNPRMSWEILSEKRNTRQTAYAIQYASSLQKLEEVEDLLWNVKVESDRSIHVVYDGPALKSRDRVYWQVKVWDNHGGVSDWSDPSFWEMGLLKDSDWSAKWIESNITEDTLISQPAQYFRKEFRLDKSVQSAKLYITSHGLYESFLNDQLIGDQVFTPGWTSYNKRLQYQVYDVTELIEQGSNAMGVTLGDGWYRGFLGWSDNRNVYGKKLALLAQLEIIYEDGSREIIRTDKSWKATNDGPIILSEIYMGEMYDARKEMEGWAASQFDDSAWGKVKVTKLPKNHLVASFGPPVKKIETIKPIKIIPKQNGSYIFDMGQNMVGWVQLKVKGQRGSTITIRHTEALDKDGNFYTENLRAAKQTIQYTCKGNEEEIFEPHFTFQGFRFVEMTGYPGKPDLESITGIVIHSDMLSTGNFVCSDSLINQLQHNIQWGLKGNFLDVPTDCPQRDERMGWTGDAQVFAPTACFNVDAASFYTKWSVDLALDQTEDGKVTDVVPDVLNGGGGHTGWADAGVIVPWTVYLNYGDERILQNQYESMKEWVHYMESKAEDNYLWLYDWHYGDWLSYDASSPSYMGAYTAIDLIATAYFAYSTDLLGRIAQVLDKPEEAEEYQNLSKKIKQAFQDEYVTQNGRLIADTQTAYTLALSMKLVPEAMIEKVAWNLNYSVHMFRHITTGFLGTPRICQTLSDFGYVDTAYMLLNRKEYPSWLYPVTMGATTIWERWDGIKPDSTFQDAGMNSLNHYAYGAIGKWLYSTVAGIDVDEVNPGYKHIIIKPQPGGGLTHAKAEIKTMYGLASSSWQIDGDQITLTVTIPPNTTASVYPPVDEFDDVRIDGESLPEWNDLVSDMDGPSITIGSGTYMFTWPLDSGEDAAN